MRILSSAPVARYVKACNGCCYLIEFTLEDLRYRDARGVDPAGFYLRCPNNLCYRHESWVGTNEPDVVARCRIYVAEKGALKELKR